MILTGKNSLSFFGVFLFEAVDAAFGVDHALVTRVERVRRGRDLDVDHGVGLPVELDGLVAGDRRAGEEGPAGSNVFHDDFFILRMNALFHNVFNISTLNQLI